MKTRSHPSTLGRIALGAAFAMTAAAAPSHAADLYAGGELGTPSYREGGINGVPGNGSGVTGKVFGGVEVAPHVAIEAGGGSLGHIDEASGTAKGRSVYLDVVGDLPVARNVSVLGRIGAAHGNIETSRGDDRGAGLNYGAGLQYKIDNDLSLRGEWEDYRLDVFGAHPNIHQYSLGLKVGF